MSTVRLNGTLLGAGAALAGAGLALLLFFAAQTPVRTVIESTPFDEYGAFTYSTSLGRNVYDDNELRVPQPLFRRLGDRLPFEYHYEVSAPLPLEGARGRYSLMAEVRQSNGWARSLPLSSDIEFFGPGFTARGVLDVATVAELIRQLEIETGYKSPTFRVRVLAHVDFEGQVAGQLLARAHDQVLDFALSDIEMRLDREASVITHSAPGEVRYPVQRARTVTVPLTGLEVTHAQLPVLSLGLLLAGAGLAAGSLLEGWRSARRDWELPRHFRKRVIEVSGPPVPPGGGGRTAEVADLEALLRLAEDYQLPVLRTTGPPITYWVLADTSYVHVAGRESPARAPMRAPPRPAATLPEGLSPPVPEAAPISSPLTSSHVGGSDASPRVSTSRAWMSFSEAPEAASDADSLGVTGGRNGLRPSSLPPGEAEQRADPPPEARRARRSRRYWGEVMSDEPTWDEREAA